MRIDRTHRVWALISLAILLISAAAYALSAVNSRQGPRGASASGLAFGIVGFGFMLFAALLGVRKRVPTWRIGRATGWMGGHLWLGVLSLPLILFHGGFHFGGALTRILMWLLIITVLSGLCGAVLQHYLPGVMTTNVPLETIYSEIGNVRNLLREEADRAMEMLCGQLGLAGTHVRSGQRAGGFSTLRPAIASEGGTAVAPATEILLLAEEESAPLRQFYLSSIRPFLEDPRRYGGDLLADSSAGAAFAALRTRLPSAAHSVLDNLQDICDEASQLSSQERLHHWLHGWLLVHIPLSLALIVLGAIHAVMALRY